MSVSYTWVGWTRHKRVYDLVMACGVTVYLGTYVAFGKLISSPPGDATDETLIIRALGTCALVMLHLVLWIGPLVRLDPRLLPLLFNRRHLGVATFFVALAHAAFTVAQFHAFGDLNPLVSLLTANTRFSSISAFPFEILGVGALLILFLMAATSHDFWLRNLSARTWKNLHMLVYVAYALAVIHVALGALQDERHVLLAVALVCGAAITASLHLIAGAREVRKDRGTPATDGWIDAGNPLDIPESRARIVCISGGERIAVYRHSGAVSAVSNVCKHQGGPIGEGKVVDGCITCPWHGWQYRPGDGCSPPPFKETLMTYPVRIVAGRVQVRSTPAGEGVALEPARIPGAEAGSALEPSRD